MLEKNKRLLEVEEMFKFQPKQTEAKMGKPPLIAHTLGSFGSMSITSLLFFQLVLVGAAWSAVSFW